MKAIFGLMSVVSLLGGSAFAQDCETYDLHGAVTSEHRKPIEGALVELLDYESKKPIRLDRWGKPLPKLKSGRDGSYGLNVASLPTYSERGDRRSYVLRVTAAGFLPHEQKVDIELCGFKLDISLGQAKRRARKVEKTR